MLQDAATCQCQTCSEESVGVVDVETYFNALNRFSSPLTNDKEP